MRHCYFRIVIGIVWLLVAVVNVTKGLIPFAVLYCLVGVFFLISAYSIWKKEKDNRG